LKDKEAMSATIPVPASIEDIIAGLKSFGIEDYEEILTVKSGGKEIQLKLANICTEEEMNALLAVEEFKGYAWIQRVKCEVLSRAISYINGVNLRDLTPQQRVISDPTSGQLRDIQVVLRNLLMGWGQEVVGILWKVLMTHANRVEQNLFDQFPDASVMNEYERRFIEQAQQQYEAENAKVIADSIEEMKAEPAEE
jgi:hypothetical protein